MKLFIGKKSSILYISKYIISTLLDDNFSVDLELNKEQILFQKKIHHPDKKMHQEQFNLYWCIK